MRSRIRIIRQVLLLSLFAGKLSAQAPGLTGLYKSIQERQAIPGYARDTAYIDLLTRLAHNYYGIDADSAFHYGREALDLAQQAGYQRGASESWRMIGNTYEMTGDYPNMLASYHKSLAIAEKIPNPSLVAKAHLNISLFYKDVGDYEDALAEMAKVTRLYEKDADSFQLAYVLDHQADIFFRKKEYEKALQYQRQALAVVSGLHDYPTAATFGNSLGKILASRGEYQESLQHHLQSLAYYQQRDDKLGITETSAFLARTYLLLKDYPNALHYAGQSLALARKIHRKKEISEAGSVLAAICEDRGDYRQALSYYKLYKTYSDSLYDEATRKQIFALESRHEYEKKAALLQEENDKKDILRRNAEKNHALQIFIAILLILFLSALALTLFRSRADKHRSNLLLQTKNQEINRQKEEIEHQAVQLLLNNQQKDKLFSIIAHDLKGPLNSLKGLLDFLKEHSLSDAEISNMMAELRRNVDYSAELVGNLLFWASSQLDGIVAVPVPLPLRQLTAGIIPLFAKQVQDKSIQLHNEVDPTLVAFADKDMIQVILRNLLSNAVKFCRTGDSITVNGRQYEGYVEICVADTGIGIHKDVLEKISRKESVTTYGTAKEKGTGLGMLLCREFAEVNKGRFWIESQLGKGSCFYFTVPPADNSSSISV